MAPKLFKKEKKHPIIIYGTDLTNDEWEALKRAAIKTVLNAIKEGIEKQNLDKKDLIERECQRAVSDIYFGIHTIEITGDIFKFSKADFKLVSKELEELSEDFEKRYLPKKKGKK